MMKAKGMEEGEKVDRGEADGVEGEVKGGCH